MKAKIITIIQEEFTELKVEKVRLRTSIKKYSKNLKNATQVHFALLFYRSKTNVVNVIQTTPTPIPHHQYMTT